MDVINTIFVFTMSVSSIIECKYINTILKNVINVTKIMFFTQNSYN